jgi:hypothetical protein
MRRLHLHGLLLVQVRRATADLVVNSDAKVANRDTKVWHFVIENGYPKISLSRCSGDTITLLLWRLVRTPGCGAMSRRLPNRVLLARDLQQHTTTPSTNAAGCPGHLKGPQQHQQAAGQCERVGRGPRCSRRARRRRGLRCHQKRARWTRGGKVLEGR